MALKANRDRAEVLALMETFDENESNAIPYYAIYVPGVDRPFTFDTVPLRPKILLNKFAEAGVPLDTATVEAIERASTTAQVNEP